jgi:ABC-2 type transport system permease protein
MSRSSPRLRVLVGKELRQVRRSKGALISATVLPLFLMTGMPLFQLFAMRGAAVGGAPVAMNLPAGMAAVGNDPVHLLVRLMLPMFLVLGGLLVPTVAATYTVVAEREKRSIELLMALPVRVGDILLAKLLAMLALAAIVVLPLFAVDMAVLLALGLIGVLEVALLLVLLLAALACSVGVALLLALLARDFRTANNLNGAFIVPAILATLAVLFLLPSPLSYAVLGALLLALAAAAMLVGVRWLTFERYVA